MKNLYVSAVAVGLGVLGVAASRALLSEAPVPAAVPTTFPADVTQHHKHDSRDGLYLDPLFTQAASANLTRDLSFDGPIVGNVYAQPLYIDATSSPNGSMVIAVTESNNVYALNASTGAIIWQRNVGTPASSMGNISPVGITGTPVADLASHSLFFDAVISGPNNLIFSLNFDTGDINPGWPVNVNASVPGFSSSIQSQRAALGIMGSKVYVPYGGYFGDAGNYHGLVVGVQMSNPASVSSWATTATKSGIWGPGGISNDGTNLFVTTGNATSGTGTWGGQEAIVRLQAGPVFTGATTDYWAPTNWQSLDSGDTDLGGSGPILVDVPGANPSALVVALGKDGNAYLVNRNNLGGIGAPVSQSAVGGTIIQAAATYRTALGTYVVYRRSSSVTTAFRITATNPPTVATGWTITGQSGRSSPFVTTTDGISDAIVWVVGSGGDNRLHGYNGDTGAVIYAGGGANELMTGTRGYNANAIAARGRIYVAADNKVYAFSVSTSSTPTPTATATATATPTATAPPTPTATATATATASPTATATATATATTTAAPTPSPSATPTATTTVTPTATATVSETPIHTPSPTSTATATATASPTPTETVPPSPTAAPSPVQALNISTRMRVDTGSNVLIGGFIVAGTASKNVVLRGVGPSLAGSGVPADTLLANPTLELRDGTGSLVIANDDWRDDPVQAAQLTSVGLGLQEPSESGIAATLQPGAYTAILAGKNQTAGVGLVEIYDIDQTSVAQLANISTRGFVLTGDNVMIGGFILGGSNVNTHVAVRGIGPSLSKSGLNNLLADPTLELHDGNGTLLVANDNWQDDPVSASQLLFHNLALPDSHESGIYTSLPPGLFTAILAGKDGGTGLGLVEIYDIP